MLAKRTAIIDYLKSLESPKPAVAKDAGRVSANFETGYVVLVPEGKANCDGIRLTYTKTDRTREIAAGKYTVRRYVIENGEWAVWATGAGRAVTVKAGETTKLELDLDVQLKMTVMKHGKKTQIGGSFSGDSGMGLSLLKGDARVVVKWEVAEDTGECAYG